MYTKTETVLANTSFCLLFFSMLFYWFQVGFLTPNSNETERIVKTTTTSEYQLQQLQYNGSIKNNEKNNELFLFAVQSKFLTVIKNFLITQLGFFSMIIAQFCLMGLLILRWVESGHFPLSNLYESLIFLSWSLTFLYIFLEQWIQNPFLGGIISPCALFINAFASFSLPEEMQKSSALVPALQSNWLMMHVTVMILSYTALILGSLLSIAFLVLVKINNNYRRVSIITDKYYPLKGLASLTPSVLGKASVPKKIINVDQYQDQNISGGFLSQTSKNKKEQGSSSLTSYITSNVGEIEEFPLFLSLPSTITTIIGGLLPFLKGYFPNTFGVRESKGSSKQGTLVLPKANFSEIGIDPEFTSITTTIGVVEEANTFFSKSLLPFPSPQGKREESRTTGIIENQLEKLMKNLDYLSYRILGIGFPLLTIGILSGAVWANEAWGSYWSWDPKETWALLTWFVFAIYLHTRLNKGWQGEKPALIASIGFMTVWICFLGVNLIGEGLHSYGWFNT